MGMTYKVVLWFYSHQRRID